MNPAESFSLSILDDASKIPVAFVVKITPSRKALACKVSHHPYYYRPPSGSDIWPIDYDDLE